MGALPELRRGNAFALRACPSEAPAPTDSERLDDWAGRRGRPPPRTSSRPTPPLSFGQAGSDTVAPSRSERKSERAVSAETLQWHWLVAAGPSRCLALRCDQSLYVNAHARTRATRHSAATCERPRVHSCVHTYIHTRLVDLRSTYTDYRER